VWIFTQDKSEISDEVLAVLNPAKIIDSELLDSPLEHLILMSRGAGLICSNSTFSWWPAFLVNEWRVIAPSYTRKLTVFTPEMTLDA
jgi:hypothetical protein